jgi:sugar lactone lactonase YvrE
VDSVEVLTQGSPNLDFKAEGSFNCVAPLALPGPEICTQPVTFTPAAPGVRVGAVVLLDSNKEVLGTAYVSGIGLGGLGVLVPGEVIPVAGVYRNWESTKDGIPATEANLWLPSSMTLDGAGNLYIADSNHNRIRMVAAPVAPATVGFITTFAGTGEPGYSGDGHAATDATLSGPAGVALDGAGNLYIADSGNNVIRMINPAGIITTVAGNGAAGYGGDGLAASSPQVEFNQPQGITVDADGNLYIADTYNQRIRRVDAITGIITTAAGNGDPSGKGDNKGTYAGDAGLAIKAGLSLPYTVAFDVSGNMYVPDSANNVIRMVAAVNGTIAPGSTISTIVGFFPGTAGSSGDNGPANKSKLNMPTGVAADAAGDIYIADTQNSRIRKVNAATMNIATLAASTPAGPAGLVGAPPPVDIYAPAGLFLDGSGDLYFADLYDMLIEEIESNKAVLNFTATSVYVGSQSKPLTETVENDGNAALDFTAFTPDANAAVDPGSTTCSLTTELEVDTDCLIGAIFAPLLTTPFPPGATSEIVDGNVDGYGNTVNSPLNFSNFPPDIEVVGVAIPVNATILALTSSANPSDFGQNVAFTVTVTSGVGQGTPTGTATFTDTFLGVTTPLGSPITLDGSGAATYLTTTLAVGAHTITAAFTPSTGAKYLPSPPVTLVQTVGEVTATTLISSANPSVLGAIVTLTAKVRAPRPTWPGRATPGFTGDSSLM